MNQELDYAEMLEIPVSTVNVVKKKSFFKRKQKPTQPTQDELKDMVVDSVNERIGAFTYAEDVSDPPKPEKKHKGPVSDTKGSRIIICELAAVCLLALAIFLTNFFMPTSAINTFISSIANPKQLEAEATYSDLKLSPVVSELSDAEVTVSENGVLSFTAKSSVYPICDGTVTSVSQNDGIYTVQINHTSTFKSVITGLSTVYTPVGTKVESNIPFAYSDGEKQVSVSMYDGETLLDCYTLTDEVPVWNS